MSAAVRCPKKIGGTYRCGGLMRPRTDAIGRMLWDCPRCARFAAGICQDCPAPVDGVVGKARRCAACRTAKDRRRANHYWQLHQREISTKKKRAWRKMRRLRPALSRQQVGRIAGAARAAALSPERRREIARLAGIASGAARRAQRQQAQGRAA